MTDELKPCPWCKESIVCFEPIRTTMHRVKFAVVCKKCGGHGPLKETEMESCAAWNTRAEPGEMPGWMKKWIEYCIDVGTPFSDDYNAGYEDAMNEVLSLKKDDS